jgi:hypothetical protein
VGRYQWLALPKLKSWMHLFAPLGGWFSLNLPDAANISFWQYGLLNLFSSVLALLLMWNMAEPMFFKCP